MNSVKRDDVLLNSVKREDDLLNSVTRDDTLCNVSVQLKVDADFMVRGGSLGDSYKVAQVHFHWGKTNFRGSEHQKNGKAYPLEVSAIKRLYF